VILRRLLEPSEDYTRIDGTPQFDVVPVRKDLLVTDVDRMAPPELLVE
jgi:hypothetical protein